MTRCFVLLCVSLISGGLCHAGGSKEAPDWVIEAAAKALPSYPGKTPAVELLAQQHVTVDAAGSSIIVERQAIKILTREGRESASASVYYYKGGRKVKQFHAWLVAPSGFVKTYDKTAIIDVGAWDAEELYNDIRTQHITANNPEIGSVFAYEYEVEAKNLFAQDQYLFQTSLPVLLSRYSLTLPAGWTARAKIFNYPPLEPVLDGSTYTWQLTDLPFREGESHGPALSSSAPRLAVDFAPVAGSSSLAICFKTWSDVSRWQTELSAGQDEVKPSIAAKAKELAAPYTAELDKIRAIGHYVQKLKYVAIEMDEQHGGGYKPHPADMVLLKQYGDCKDKANLMKAMLKAEGIDSYLVAIFSGDRTYVKSEWPSPEQFNHMIVAVRVSAATAAPTISSDPKLGRLLIFDPTSEVTPLGSLPFYEQGSYALICAGNSGLAMQMPVLPPEANLVSMNVDTVLHEGGGMTAKLRVVRRGSAASADREDILDRSESHYRQQVLAYLGQVAKAPEVQTFDVRDDFAGDQLQLTVEFSSAAYAQIMQNHLYVFTPSVVPISAPALPMNEHRTTPVLLNAQDVQKTVTLRLPTGFKLDEAPVPVKLDSAFGHFEISFRNENGSMVMTEELKVSAQEIPASQYKAVKSFFDNVRGADLQRVVLEKN